MVLSFDTIEMPMQELRAQATFDSMLMHFPGVGLAMAEATAMQIALGMPSFLESIISHMPQAAEMPQVSLVGVAGLDSPA
jgi:sorbitol-specific phosphotransferase system component IIBC